MDGRRPRCAHCGLAGGPVPTAISPCAGRLRFSRRSASARSPSPSAAGRRTCAGTSAATSPGRKRPSLRSLADVGDPVEPRRPDHQATVAGEEEAAGAPRGRAAHADRRGAPSRISSGSGLHWRRSRCVRRRASRPGTGSPRSHRPPSIHRGLPRGEGACLSRHIHLQPCNRRLACAGDPAMRVECPATRAMEAVVKEASGRRRARVPIRNPRRLPVAPRPF